MQSLRGGGAERNLLRLAGGLATRGHHITIVTTDTSEAVGAWLPEHVEIIDLGVKHYPLAFWPLSRWLRARRPDVLVAAMSAANAMAIMAARLAGGSTTVIVTERNTASVQRGDATTLRRRFITPWLMRVTYPRARWIVAVSDGVADDLASFVRLPRDRIIAIPNPVVDETLSERAQESLPAPWSTTIGDRPLIVSAGRLEPHKDHQLLIRALVTVRKHHPDVMLAIIGQGPERSSLEQLAARLGVSDAVVMPGFQENPFAWMASADVVALASRYEGLPTVLIEALGCGARVVATDCPSGPSEILEEGRWGQLVPVGDVAALALALAGSLNQGRWPAPPDEALARYRQTAVIDRWEELITGR